MAREYPRFLVTKEMGNTKSKGPFLIHTLTPRFIAKILKNASGYFYLEFIELWEPDPNGILKDITQICVNDAGQWVRANAILIDASF